MSTAGLESPGVSLHVQHDDTRRAMSVIVRLLLAVGLTAAFHGVFGVVHWQRWLAYPCIGITIASMEWGGERIWHLTVGRLAECSGGPLNWLTRIPFWFLAGGIGYAGGMLAAKKMFLIGFYDIPVKPIFMVGGAIGFAVQSLSVIVEFIHARYRR